MTMIEDYLQRILRARVYDVAQETPLDLAPELSRRLKNSIWLKREDLQPVFSFKLRGAYNKIVQLTETERNSGIIAASAGNHAQGVALAAKKLNLEATIVMPKTTPGIKVDSVKRYGAHVVLHGNTYDEASEHAYLMAAENGMTFVHPYDDPDVIAGQGTVAVEIFRQHPDNIDAVFVPVGGGGLISGVGAYIKSLWPNVKVIGVEPVDAACLYHALKNNERVVLDQVGIFADGVAVRQVGKLPFEIAKRVVDDVICVDTDEICAAIKDIFDDTRSITEPAGALAVAGLKKYIEKNKIKGQQLVAIASGANMNFDRLRHVAERAELGENREMLVSALIPERPGSFRQFCHLLGQRSITEFNYRFSDPDNARVFAGIQLRESDKEKSQLLEKLAQHGYEVCDLSSNELAKLHIRYMVGGHSKAVQNEQIIRFEFPERPGALLRFLTHLGQRWNISLFHYRNHGAAYGRVLAGIQVDEPDKEEFEQFLEKLGYEYWKEGDNPAYIQFLGYNKN